MVLTLSSVPQEPAVHERAFGELLDLSAETIYLGIARGDLEAIRIGRVIRLPRAQLASLVIGGVGDADAQGQPEGEPPSQLRKTSPTWGHCAQIARQPTPSLRSS